MEPPPAGELGHQKLRGSQNSLLGGVVFERGHVERHRSAGANVDVLSPAHGAHLHPRSSARFFHSLDSRLNSVATNAIHFFDSRTVVLRTERHPTDDDKKIFRRLAA